MPIAERAPRLAVAAPLDGRRTRGVFAGRTATRVTDPDELHWRQL
ncbi:hypothetical protein [Kitasatospora sp. NPDC059673]